MKVVECPYCGTSLFDYLVEDIFGAIVGCSECTRQLTAEEYLEEED
jgi:DNA-directed RNA polymerase subunit RPC12/RpoP